MVNWWKLSSHEPLHDKTNKMNAILLVFHEAAQILFLSVPLTSFVFYSYWHILDIFQPDDADDEDSDDESK